MAWSDTEIDDYLYRVIAARRAEQSTAAAVAATVAVAAAATAATATEPSTRAAPPQHAERPALQTEDVLKCQPRLKVIPVTHFYPRPPGQRTNYRPSCVALHRCTPDGGCCREHHACGPKTSRNVTIGFAQVALSHHGGAEESRVYLSFENHTECHCHSSLPRTPLQCMCPWPYIGSFQSNQRCECRCPDVSVEDGGNQADATCAAISSGQRGLPWPLSRNNDMSKVHYRTCAAAASVNASGHNSAAPLVSCGLPACHFGSFSFANWSCPSASSRDPPVSTSGAIRHSRGDDSRDAASARHRPRPHGSGRQHQPTSGEAIELAKAMDSGYGRAVAKRSDGDQQSRVTQTTVRPEELGNLETWDRRILLNEDNVVTGNNAKSDGRKDRTSVSSEPCRVSACTSSRPLVDDRQPPLRVVHDQGGRSQQLPEAAELKLLAWTRPGVILERGGSAARTKFGRELWSAAESLWQQQVTSGCSARPPKATVSVDSSGSSVSCSLHDRSHKYLIRTARGSLLCSDGS